MSASASAAILMSTALSILVLGLTISTMTILPAPARAASLVSLPGAKPSVGDYVPRSMHIIGVDGESYPRAYGMLIFDGKIIALVDAKTRKIMQIVSDEPL
jgi:hypothetical protein